MKNKNLFFKFCPYICGLLYGVFAGVSILKVIEWALKWFSTFSDDPMEYLEAFTRDTFILIGIILLCLACFAAVLILNIIAFKKIKPKVYVIILECILTFFTVYPSAILFAYIKYNVEIIFGFSII